MGRIELLKVLAKKTDIRQNDLADVLDALAEVVYEEVVALKKDAKLVIPGIVVLRKRLMPAKLARSWTSPLTGQIVSSPAKPALYKIKVTLDKALKHAPINE